MGAAYADDPLFFYFDEPLRLLNLDQDSRARALEQVKAEFKRRQIKYIIVFLKFVDDEQKSDLDRLAQLLQPQNKMDTDQKFRMYEFDFGVAR